MATLLAEHLMLAAERAGIRRLTALAQREDQEMLAVFLSLGMPVEQEWDGTGCALAIPLEPVAGALHGEHRGAQQRAKARLAGHRLAARDRVEHGGRSPQNLPRFWALGR